MKINWIIAHNSLAGGTKSNRLIAEAMSRRGHDVQIYYSSAPGQSPPIWRVRTYLRWVKQTLSSRYFPPVQHLSISTVPVTPINKRPIPHHDVRDADVTIATWWQTAEWIADWPASKGLKAYFIRHYEVWGGEPVRVDATYRLPLRKLVISKWLQRLMVNKFEDPDVVLVPNGVDRCQFNAPERCRNATPVVGFMVGDAKWKGSCTAIEAVWQVREQFPKLRVICFGATAHERSQSLPDGFEFHHKPSQDSIASIYARTDCWIVPSTSEGFGMPGLEAGACRCPIVSTRCGGPEDYVQDGINGFLVPVGDAVAMADAVIKILSQSHERWKQMSDASYRISLEFDWDRSAEILEMALLADLSRCAISVVGQTAT